MNIYDVAREAGVSIATVSRVINNHPQVSDKTRNKINDILKKYNYTPNAIARGLVVKSMKSVGVLTIDIRDVYYANVAHTIEQEFSKLGYSVILCNTGGDVHEKTKYMKMLSEKKVDGLILVGSVFRDKKTNKVISQMAQELPIVMVNGFLEAQNVYSIICDDSYGISMCVDHLAAKGHTDIVYLKDADTFSAQAKEDGFKLGLRNNNLALNPAAVLRVEKGLSGGYQAVDQLIRSKQKFSAIVCGEDITAVGAVKKLQQLNINIPSDVAVTGFNNSIISQCCTPELTSVDNMMETTGISAVRILNDVFENRIVPSKTVITPDLVIRKST